MSFYNPYMKKPDYAQGFSDMINQALMMYMMEKMFGDSQSDSEKSDSKGQTPMTNQLASNFSLSQSASNQMPYQTPKQISNQTSNQNLYGFSGFNPYGGQAGGYSQQALTAGDLQQILLRLRLRGEI